MQGSFVVLLGFVTLLESSASAGTVGDLPAIHQEVEVTWVDRGHYTLPAPPGVELGDVEFDTNGLTWEYMGQNEYSIWFESMPETLSTSEPVPDPTRFEDWVTTIERIDGNDAIWKVVDHNEAAIPDGLVEQFERSRSDDIGDDEVDEWMPMSWTNGTCGPTSTPVNIWETDSRNTVSLMNTTRAKRTLFWLNSQGQSCSGVLTVGPDPDKQYMVTAAHCAMTSPGGTVLGVNWICSQGNTYSGADCVQTPSGGFTVVPSPGWLGGSSVRKHDYAVITWAKYLTCPSGLCSETSAQLDRRTLEGIPAAGMPIASQSNAQIDAESVGTYGHPQFTSPTVSPTLGCATTNTTAQETPGVFNPIPNFGRSMFFEFRTDHDVSTNYVRTKLDGTGGSSGSGLINCPGGCGATGGGEELVGLFVAAWWEGANFRTGGPKWTWFQPLVGVL